MEMTKTLNNEEVKHELVQNILRAFMSKGETPFIKVFRSNHYQHIDVINELERDQTLQPDGDHYRVPLIGLVESPVWSLEIRTANDILKTLDHLYAENPIATISVEQLQRDTMGVLPQDIQRILTYFLQLGLAHGTQLSSKNSRYFASITPDEKVRAGKSFKDWIFLYEEQRRSWIQTLAQQASGRKTMRWDFDSKLPIYSDRNLLKNLQVDIDQCIKDELPISVLFLDLDHFKAVNDTNGHVAGDKVLIGTAELIRKFVGNKGDVVRNGGEEIICILPNSNLDEAKILAERIRLAVSMNKVQVDDQLLQVTVSIGIQTHTKAIEAIQFIKEADKAMYKAKNGGRNRIEVFTSTDNKVA